MKAVEVVVDLTKSSLVHSADLCRGGVRVRVMVKAVINKYAM